LGPFGKSSEPLTEYLSEGPTVVKVGKNWLLYYDNYGSKNYKALSTSDFVKFEDVSSKIKLPEGHKHGTITTISEEVLKGLKQKNKTQISQIPTD
jgi:hypothetical protein